MYLSVTTVYSHSWQSVAIVLKMHLCSTCVHVCVCACVRVCVCVCVHVCVCVRVCVGSMYRCLQAHQATTLLAPALLKDPTINADLATSRGAVSILQHHDALPGTSSSVVSAVVQRDMADGYTAPDINSRNRDCTLLLCLLLLRYWLLLTSPLLPSLPLPPLLAALCLYQKYVGGDPIHGGFVIQDYMRMLTDGIRAGKRVLARASETRACSGRASEPRACYWVGTKHVA